MELRHIRHFRGNKFFRIFIFILGVCALALMVRTSSDYYSNELVFTEFSSNSLNKVDTDISVDKSVENVMTSSATPPVSSKTKSKKNSHSKKPKDENDQV